MSSIQNVTQTSNVNSTDLFSTSRSTSSSANIDINFKNKLTKEEIIKKFELKDEDLAELRMKYPDLFSKSESEIKKIIDAYKTSIPQNSQQKEKSVNKTTGQNYDFKAYKKTTDPKQKAKMLLEEYAKNIYQSEWATFTEEQKQQKIVEIANGLIKDFSSDENLDIKQLVEAVNDPNSKINKDILSDSKKIKKINTELNSRMLDIQVANEMGISVKDLLDNKKVNKTDRNAYRHDLMFNFINGGGDLKDFSYQDIEFYKEYNLAIESGKKFFNDENLTAKDLQEKIALYNEKHPNNPINTMSLRYDYLKKDIKLDENQIKTFNKLIFKTDKIQGPDLKKFFELINKSELTAKEQAQLDKLKNKTELSDEELNQLKELTKSSGFDFDKFEQYRNLSVKDVITGGRLGEFPEADSGNTAIIKMGKSEVFKQAMQKYKDKPNAYELAMTDYLKDMFPEGLDKSEFQKRLNTLLGGCNDRTQRRVLQNLKDNGFFERYKDYVPSDNEMYAGGYAVFDSVEVNRISDPKKKTFWRNASANYGVITKDYKRTLDFNRTGGDIDLGYQREIAAEYGNKEEYVEQVVNNFPKNPELYTLDAQKNIIQTGGIGLEGLMTEDEEDQYAKIIGSSKAVTKNSENAKLYSASGHTYHGKAQIAVANKSMEISHTFDDETAKEIQKTLADDIQNYETSNQVQAHKIVSSSKYSEIQEYAASNIHNYDPTAQAGAIEATYETGNQSAITACEAQLNQCSGVNASESTYANYVQNQSTVQAINDAIANGDSKQLIEIVQNNNIEITRYINSCSQKDKEIFVENLCKAASESQLLNFIKNNSSMLDLVMRYANGKISKDKLFGTVYKGNKGEIRNLLNTLGIKGADVVKLATTYKEYAPDIALAVESSALARAIITDPAAWGYQMGRTETQKLQQIASKKNITKTTETDTQPETAMTLRPRINDIDSLQIFRNREGFLSA